MQHKQTHEIVYFEVVFKNSSYCFARLEEARNVAESLKDSVTLPGDERDFPGDRDIYREDTTRSRTCSWGYPLPGQEQHRLDISVPMERRNHKRSRKTLIGPDGLEYFREDYEYGEWEPHDSLTFTVRVFRRVIRMQGEPEIRKFSMPINSI